MASVATTHNDTMKDSRLSILGLIFAAFAIAGSGCANSPLSGKPTQKRAQLATHTTAESVAAPAKDWPPMSAQPSGNITVRSKVPSNAPHRPVNQITSAAETTAHFESSPSNTLSSRVTTPPQQANSAEQLTELDLKELDRVLNSSESPLPQQYQEYLRTQLIAIAGRGSTALPPERVHPDRLVSPSDATVPPTNPVQPDNVAGSNVSLASHTAGTPATTTLPAAPPAVPSQLSNESSAAPAREELKLGRPPALEPVQTAALSSSSTKEKLKPNAPADASEDELQKGEWRVRLVESIDYLEKELARYPSSDRETVQMAKAVRLLHLIANNREKAVAALEELSEDEQEYWKHQLHALLIAFDANDMHAGSRRAALALRELRQAADHLANQSTLDVRNLAFCEAVESFGVYTPVKSLAFKAGQPVLLYVELDNFTVKQSGDNYETKFQAEYNIVDASGGRINKKLNPIEETDGRSRRRDYFMSCQLEIPKDLKPGPYTLQLIVEDVIGQKSSEAKIEFRVR
jgi:hypothetical protein